MISNSTVQLRHNYENKERKMSEAMDVDIPVTNEEQEEEEEEQQSDQPVTKKQSTKSEKRKFEVRKWTAVAFWSWDIVVENCAICRNHLMEPCIECQPNSMSSTSNECMAAWGACNHAFHMHCISKWLKTRNSCPLDNRDWQFQKYGK